MAITPAMEAGAKLINQKSWIRDFGKFDAKHLEEFRAKGKAAKAAQYRQPKPSVSSRSARRTPQGAKQPKQPQKKSSPEQTKPTTQ